MSSLTVFVEGSSLCGNLPISLSSSAVSGVSISSILLKLGLLTTLKGVGFADSVILELWSSVVGVFLGVLDNMLVLLVASFLVLLATKLEDPFTTPSFG